MRVIEYPQIVWGGPLTLIRCKHYIYISADPADSKGERAQRLGVTNVVDDNDDNHNHHHYNRTATTTTTATTPCLSSGAMLFMRGECVANARRRCSFGGHISFQLSQNVRPSLLRCLSVAEVLFQLPNLMSSTPSVMW